MVLPQNSGDSPMLIRKPWRVACLNTCLPRLLKTCDHSHVHAPCVGRETLFTQGYTPEICRIIHEAIKQDMRGLSVHLRSARHTSAPAVSQELPSGASASQTSPLQEWPTGASQSTFVTVSYSLPVAVSGSRSHAAALCAPASASNLPSTNSEAMNRIPGSVRVLRDMPRKGV